MFSKKPEYTQAERDMDLASQIKKAAERLVELMTLGTHQGLNTVIQIAPMPNNQGYAVTGFSVSRSVLAVEPPKPPGVTLPQPPKVPLS